MCVSGVMMSLSLLLGHGHFYPLPLGLAVITWLRESPNLTTPKVPRQATHSPYTEFQMKLSFLPGEGTVFSLLVCLFIKLLQVILSLKKYFQAHGRQQKSDFSGVTFLPCHTQCISCPTHRLTEHRSPSCSHCCWLTYCSWCCPTSVKVWGWKVHFCLEL